ncbi:MAG TPA: universal stress protein [Ferruginibacter sp.]|nr:universal stress protein [Ferruginibacter sp.]HMP21860.1 universal stress protein [Ferruginibacter sp.]
MPTILVPTDFSVPATHAANLAAAIAKKSGAAILLFHAIEPVTEKIRQPFALLDKLSAEMKSAAEKNMEHFSLGLQLRFPGVTVHTALEEGNPVQAVLEAAAQYQPELIVMGTKGASSLQEIIIGSVAAGIIGKSACPVLIIPDEALHISIEEILITTNQFEKAPALLQPLINLARLFNATVDVAVFLDTDTAGANDYLTGSRQIEQYTHYLQKTFEGIRFKGQVLDGKAFETTISQYCSTHKIDCICMFTYPKSIWEKLLQKSATRKMAYHTHIPLLAIPVK